MREILQQLLTESDNVTHDIYRYLALLSILVGLSLTIYSVAWQGKEFDMQSFGVGIGALFTGAGIALGLKKEGS